LTFSFTDIVDKVSNHICCLDERETKDEIHGNVGACCNLEGGVIAVLSSIMVMNIKPKIKFCGVGCGILCVHNTGENNGHVIIGQVDLLQNMRVLADHRFNEMKLSSAEGSSGVKDTLEGWTVCFIKSVATRVLLRRTSLLGCWSTT
jgi:hypothetical protein